MIIDSSLMIYMPVHNNKLDILCDLWLKHDNIHGQYIAHMGLIYELWLLENKLCGHY